MQITEKHIQNIYNRLEKLMMEEKVYYAYLFGISAFKTELMLILKAKSEEDLKKSEEFANAVMKILYDDKLTPDKKTEKIVSMIRNINRT